MMTDDDRIFGVLNIFAFTKKGNIKEMFEAEGREHIKGLLKTYYNIEMSDIKLLKLANKWLKKVKSNEPL
jgi:hypothetical protein